MNKTVPIAIATLIGFGAGILAHTWINDHAPMPAPPTSILGEMRDTPPPSTTSKKPDQPKPPTPPRNEDSIKQLKAEIDAFKKRLDPLKEDFKQHLEALLTPEQKDRLKAMSEPPASPKNKDGTDPKKSPTRPPRERTYDGMDSTITLVMVPFTLARFTEELQLTDAQKIEVNQLLLTRRARFLELVDQTPPPSFKLGKIAPPPEPTKAP